MRKRITVLCLLSLLFAAGCTSGGKDDHAVTKANDVNDIIQSAIAAEDREKETTKQGTTAVEIAADSKTPTTVVHTPEADETITLPSSDVDVDLTIISSAMVYAEVYGMVTEPQDYVGKTVRMNGQYATQYIEETDIRYHACIIQDATACCAQGIEFILKGNPAFPDAYPEPEEIITVVGCFDTYMEGEYMYCTLRDAVVE